VNTCGFKPRFIGIVHDENNYLMHHI